MGDVRAGLNVLQAHPDIFGRLILRRKRGGVLEPAEDRETGGVPQRLERWNEVIEGVWHSTRVPLNRKIAMMC